MNTTKTIITILLTSFVFCSTSVHAGDAVAAAEAEKGGCHILIVWPDAGDAPEITAEEFAVFLGSIKKTDRLAIFLPLRRELVLRFDTDIASNPTARATEIMGAIDSLRVAEPMASPPSMRDSLETVADKFRNTKNASIKAIVLLPRSSVSSMSQNEESKTDSVPSSDSDARGDGRPNSELENMLMRDEILLFPVFKENTGEPLVESLSSRMGGRSLFLSPRFSVRDALASVYETVQLRAFELDSEEPLYNSDLVCPAGTMDPAFIEESRKQLAAAFWMQVTGLGLLVLLFLSFGGLLWRLRRAGFAETTSHRTPDKKGRETPAFSKVSIGVSRIRNAFAQAESQLVSLSADIEDFGSENWDTQKNMVSAYAEIADQLFLLLDHVEIKESNARTEMDEFMTRRIGQILEDCGIEALIPEVGTKYHSKFHSHAAEKDSDAPAGTILETVRKGYQRKKGFKGGEPFVIRQAEVIVSRGVPTQKETR